MVKQLVLIGAGGFGREVAQIIESLNRQEKRYELLGFLDDGAGFTADTRINGYPWLGGSDWMLAHRENVVCTCTIGQAAVKARVQNRLMAQGVCFETILAPTAGVANHSELGPGCVLYWGAGVSVNCRLGAGILLNDGVRIGHDVTIGDFTAVSPGTRISGECTIGAEVQIGGNAFVVPGKKIGDRAHIAAGSIVFSNVRAGTTVLGNPARRMRELE